MFTRNFLVALVALALSGCVPKRDAIEGDVGDELPLKQAGPGFYQEVSWAPVGSALILSVLEPSDRPEGFSYRVHRLALDPPRLSALTAGPSDLWTSFAPDGIRIAFASQSGTTSDIFLMAADGTGRTPLTDDAGNDSQPDWSPDGR